MDDFTTLCGTVLRHLPRPAADGPLQVSDDGVQVVAPGVSVGDIAAMLAELTGDAELLPPGLAVANLRLESLALTKGNLNRGADLNFVLAWDAGELLLAGQFALKLAKMSFTKRGERLFGSAEVDFTIDDLDLALTLELPSQVVSGRLAPTDHAKADGLLKQRKLVGAAGASLRELSVQASIPFAQVDLHVELENLFTLGPLTLAEASADLCLAGEFAGSSGDVRATARFDIAGHPPLSIEVEGEIDADGWRLAGSIDTDPADLTIAALVKALGHRLAGDLPELPAVVAGLSLSHLAATIDTHDQHLHLECTLDWPHDAELVLRLDRLADSLTVDGTLTLGTISLRLSFAKGSSSVLVGSFEAAGAAAITLDELLQALSHDATQAFGPGGSGIRVGVKALAIALDAKARMLMAGELDAGIDLRRLGDLPLIGHLLPAGEPLGLQISPFYMSQGFAAGKEVRPLLPKALELPDDPIAAGAAFTARLELGGQPIRLPEFDLGATPAKAQPPTLSGSGKPAATAAPLPTGAAVKWHDIDRHLGPLHIARVGWALDRSGGPTIDLEIDASLGVGGLTLGVEGLGARYDFARGELTPRLQGMGIDFRRGQLEIGGAFLNRDGDFEGLLVVRTPTASLDVMGAFRMIDGAPSMFAYGVLDMPLGGPVFFFVEGLAAGFGVHRRIRPPEIDAVRSFPLVAGAVASALGQAVDRSPDAQLRSLHDYVSPRLGENFLAVGIKFNSFRLLDGFVVLVVSFGDELAFDLIGAIDYATPPGLPPEVPALARIQLDLIARYVVSDGILSVEGELNPNSYVYSPLCHLSGGFAFKAWMLGRRAGDFVLTVGGYHPAFVVPADYPRVGRFEMKFQVTPEVYLKGDAYFAMTPAVMMAGGGLHAQLQTGSLHAWADLTVDFLIRWEPFHYDATVHIGIGAQWKCFHTTASADLHIWGPAFSGTASVDWFIFSFDIEFGPKIPHTPVPIAIDRFKSSFLGIDASLDSVRATLGIVTSGGLIGSAAGVPVVAPDALVLGLSTRVPVRRAMLNGSELPLPSYLLGVAPAGITDLGDSTVTINVKDKHDGSDVSDRFAASRVETGFPAALWGRSMTPDHAVPTITATSGFVLKPALTATVGLSASRSVKELQMAQGMTYHRQMLMAFATQGPVPTELPIDDLLALGLDTAQLVYRSPDLGAGPGRGLAAN